MSEELQTRSFNVRAANSENSTVLKYAHCNPVSSMERLKLEIRRVINDIFVAARDKDFEALSELNDWGAGFTKFGDSPPLERLDGDNARHYDTVLFTNITDFTCVVEDLRVDIFGDTAVATCYLNYGGIFVNDYSFEARRVSAKSRATFVLHHAGGKWRVVHQHLSKLGNGDSALFGEDSPE